MDEKVFERLSNIKPVVTAHGTGEKRVFLNSSDTPTSLTQFAYGRFRPGETCEEHVHPTMEECFYFIKGVGTYTVDDKKYPLTPGAFLRIPAGVPHRLEATGDEDLEFVYFGIATK